MKEIEPTSILWEDHNGKKFAIKQIYFRGHILKFWKKGKDIILKELD